MERKLTNMVVETKKRKKIPVVEEKEQLDPILEIMTEYITIYTEDKIAANLSSKTIYNANLILERFYQFITDEYAENENLTLQDINRYFLGNYLKKLTNDGMSKATQKLHLTVIKAFLKYIADDDINKYGFIIANINGAKIKTEQREKEGFSQAEQQKILDYTAKLDLEQKYLSQRNSLMIKILLFCGVRVSELINIKSADLVEHHDENHGYIYVIKVTGKGNKERYTYLSYSVATKNLEFLRQHNPDSPYLFMSTQGKQCNRSKVFDFVGNFLKKAGVFKTGVHKFRHTFARELVEKDVNLSTIKELLGHSNISVTTQFYAKSNEHAKRNALLKN